MVNTFLVGFKPLKPGKIHLLCPKCGRKQSNNPREEAYDPPNAAVIQIQCPKCNGGDFDSEMYFDSKGNEIARS